MKSVPRIAVTAALLALLGLSGCLIDPAYRDRGRHADSDRRDDDRNRNGRDCRDRGDDQGRCRDVDRYGH